MKTVTSLSLKRMVCSRLAVLLGIILSALTASSAVVDVRQFGAQGDGKTLDTAAIQKAIDQCGRSGGGIVRFPPGTYLSKPFILRNKTILQLDEGAKLLATDDPADFHKTAKGAAESSDLFVPFIKCSKHADVGIIGKGTIDGAGARWWGPAIETREDDKNSTLPRPRMIVFTSCTNVNISGVTLQNAASFHLESVNCRNVLVEGVTFKAPTNSPNTDGINLAQCCNITIKHCAIDVGGENIVVKSTRPVPEREFASDGVIITNCAFGHGRGVSIGSEMMGGVRNVTVKDCTFTGTDYALHIKSSRNKGGTTEQIDCENLTLKDIKDAIAITCYNHGLPKSDTPQPVGNRTPVFRDIHLKNITGNCYNCLGLIAGLPESEIKNVFLENVQLSSEVTGLTIRNAKGIQLKNVHLSPKQGDPIIAEEYSEIRDLDKVRTAAN